MRIEIDRKHNLGEYAVKDNDKAVPYPEHEELWDFFKPVNDRVNIVYHDRTLGIGRVSLSLLSTNRRRLSLGWLPRDLDIRCSFPSESFHCVLFGNRNNAMRRLTNQRKGVTSIDAEPSGQCLLTFEGR